jgi:CBS domain-containing protein
MAVKQIMPTPAVTVRADEPTSAVAAVQQQHRIGGVPVRTRRDRGRQV